MGSEIGLCTLNTHLSSTIVKAAFTIPMSCVYTSPKADLDHEYLLTEQEDLTKCAKTLVILGDSGLKV